MLVDAAAEVVGPGLHAGRSIAAVEALRQIEDWGAEHVAAAAVAPGRVLGRHGDDGHVFRWASVTKPVTALAVLVAAEEGTVDLDEPAGPPGSTVRHLLAHASGLPFDGNAPIARPGERRIYSNTGFEVLAEHLAERAEIAFEAYLSQAVLEPLGTSAELRGSAAAGLWGSLEDLIRSQESFWSRVIARETLAEATTVAFPGLTGSCPISAASIRTTGASASSSGTRRSRTGRAPSTHPARSATSAARNLSLGRSRAAARARMPHRPGLGPWAKEAWPRLSDEVLAAQG